MNSTTLSFSRKWKPYTFLFILLSLQLLSLTRAAASEHRSPSTTIDTKAATVSGTITDSNGTPLIGVNVLEKNTSNGVVTDFDGRYSINTTSTDPILVFSYIGYISQEVPVNQLSRLDITLEENVNQLDEVVVVGYGTQRKKDLTGSITRIDMEEVQLPSTSSFDQMLQGKVAGVQISQTSGSPGGNVNVLVRGVSSITGGNEPLYVIDGFPIGGSRSSDFSSYNGSLYESGGIAGNTQSRINPLNAINPADIESIEILKDASATAIYGSRGSNGVVIITTKRGTSGSTQVNLDVSYGIQSVANKLDMMNSEEYAEYVAQGRDNAWVFAGGDINDPNEVRSGATRVRPEFRNPSSITTDTDWQDVIFRDAPVKNYQLSVNTGNDRTRFFISAGFFDQQGIVLTSDYQRFNLRTNVDANLSDRFKIGTSINGSYGYGNFPNTEGHYGLGGVLSQALAASPTIPVYDNEGNPYFNQDDVTDGLGWLANPLDLLNGFSDKRKSSNLLINNYVEYEIANGLVLRSTVGVNYNTDIIKIWRSSAVPRYTTLDYPANAGVSNISALDWLNENTLNFKRVINDRSVIDVLAGFTAQKSNVNRISAGASDFPTEYVTYISAGIVNAGTHTESEWSMLSAMLRVNYTYDSRYLLTATVRRDGSSRFGANNKWGTFPSLSLGYNLSEEPFMQSVNFIDNLKLRLGYGLSGNNQIGNYNHIGLLSGANYINNGNRVPGLIPSSLSNENLTWERSRQINFGIDLDLFENRIQLAVDAYRDLKTDLLLNVQLPAASGFQSATQNIGDIENRGLEIGLNTVNVRSEHFEWNSGFTFSANKNEVLKLATEGSRIANNAYQITEVGLPVSSFYLLNAVGVFATSEEVQGAAVQHPRTQAGDLRFEDVNGDGTINANDRKVVGSPWPDFTWGFNNQFTYRNLSLGISLVGSQGAETYFQAGTIVLNGAGVQNQLAEIGTQRWVSESSPGAGFQPRAIRNNYALGFATSSHFLFDASFTRIKNVNLAYRLPDALNQKLGLSGLSVYLNVANLHTWTDYPGYDPESSTGGNNLGNAGIDFLTYPLARTFTTGFKLSF